MKVLVLTPYFYPHPGGSQQYIEELYVAMQKENPALQVDILCYNTTGADKEETYRGLRIHRISCLEILPGQFALPNPVELIQLLKKLKNTTPKYDFINAHTRFFDTSWWTPLVAKYFGTVSVLTDHCADRPVHPSKMVNFVTGLVDKYWVPLIAKQYAHITVVSKATQEYLASLGVIPSTVVYPGVDRSIFKQNAAQRPGVHISFVGRLIESKGPQIFVDAIKPLLQKNPDLTATVVGNGPLLTELQKNETAQLHFTGRLDREGVAKVLAQTDIFVLPSTHHEGFPVSLLEAGASGAAVVTTDQGGTTEIIHDQKTGLIVQPTVKEVQAAIQLLAENKHLRQQLANRLNTKIEEQFSWKKTATTFLQAVQK